MMWDVVLDAWVTLLEADATLTTLMGGSVYVFPAQSNRPVRVPSIEFDIIDEREEELFNPILVQVDYWAKQEDAPAIERRIRELTHRDTARTLGDHRMWTMLIETRSHEYPADRGVIHRSMDFEFKPLRSRYAGTVQS